MELRDWSGHMDMGAMLDMENCAGCSAGSRAGSSAFVFVFPASRQAWLGGAPHGVNGKESMGNDVALCSVSKSDSSQRVVARGSFACRMCAPAWNGPPVRAPSAQTAAGSLFVNAPALEKEPRSLRARQGALSVRLARKDELHRVARIRGEAFYSHFDEVILREKQQQLYQGALVRLRRPGTFCLVAVDTLSRNPESGMAHEHVVATVDVSIFDSTGVRVPAVSENSTFPRPFFSSAVATQQRRFAEMIKEKALGTSPAAASSPSAACAHDRQFYVSSMAVCRQARRRGAAKLLLQYIKQLASREHSDRGIFLHVDETNLAAVRLYASAQFSKVADGRISWWMRSLAEDHHTLLMFDPTEPTQSSLTDADMHVQR
ncbi:hypothetical protein FVE85_4037 [Porphyridium purpureum]|uniref:N-acetyltransferase domain-containing protein n=1 Tax=Porphyridium purpureum TaxID=35688 RepID=A0A5J4YTA6_PORPP|nr:hypothetical protein FVE85_4037 [Porphyridium purpureum]|eukprot:POR5558..scf229_5